MQVHALDQVMMNKVFKLFRIINIDIWNEQARPYSWAKSFSVYSRDNQIRNYVSLIDNL